MFLFNTDCQLKSTRLLLHFRTGVQWNLYVAIKLALTSAIKRAWCHMRWQIMVVWADKTLKHHRDHSWWPFQSDTRVLKHLSKFSFSTMLHSPAELPACWCLFQWWRSTRPEGRFSAGLKPGREEQPGWSCSPEAPICKTYGCSRNGCPTNTSRQQVQK